MKVSKIHTQTAYSVVLEEKNYSVTITEDYGNPVDQWMILDSELNEVTDAEIIEPIVHLIEAFLSEKAPRMCQCS